MPTTTERVRAVRVPRRVAAYLADHRWTLTWLAGCLAIELIEVLHR